MQLKKSHDIEASRDEVFAALTDVDHWERMALRRGVDVQRQGGPSAVAAGMAWRVSFSFRGRPRDVAIRLSRVDLGKSLDLTATGKALEATTRVDLAEMAPRRTRITVTVDVAARTLAARLFLQSLRLAPGRVRQRFDSRIAQIAEEIEARSQSGARKL
jgi:carbon monoxide dehydrogenase subunit G